MDENKTIAGVFEVERTHVYKITIYEDPRLLDKFNRKVASPSGLSDMAAYIAEEPDSAFVFGVGKVGEAFDIEEIFDDTEWIDYPTKEVT